MKHIFFLVLLAGILHSGLSAQNKGHLSGSLESNSIYYVKDSKLDVGNSVNPDDHFGSNNYLKLDYTYGKFSAGLQLEGYLPALQGYDMGLYGTKDAFLGMKYVSWQDDNFAFRVGDIFEQFGSGMIFRSFEDRTLGINNSVEGIFGSYSYRNFITLKGIYGRPRLYSDYADSWVRGADLSLSLSDIAGWKNLLFSVEGSYINRYEEVPEEMADIAEPSIDMFSARANFDWNGFNASVEYVGKSNDVSPSLIGVTEKGHGLLAEMGYSCRNFSILATYRELKYMNTQLSLTGEGVGNVLNYLPALTRQYTYMLANLNPYQSSGEGERGGQIDAYYSWRSKSNRSRYVNLHANASLFYSDKAVTPKTRMLWRDINGDIEFQWNKQLKTTFLVSVQEWSPSHGLNDKTYASNIFVLDALYKFDRKKSVRAEVQYLYSEDYEKDWVAGLVEFNLAPHWSFSVSDMYNHGTSKVHYYSGSVSYTQKNTRLQLSYGRNRAGYVCSGGVCRYTPAYTGANLTLTTSF